MDKIQWHKMHIHDYQGNCVYCGGECTSEESEKEWRKAVSKWLETDHELQPEEFRYLSKKLKEKVNYRFVR